MTLKIMKFSSVPGTVCLSVKTDLLTAVEWLVNVSPVTYVRQDSSRAHAVQYGK